MLKPGRKYKMIENLVRMHEEKHASIDEIESELRNDSLCFYIEFARLIKNKTYDDLSDSDKIQYGYLAGIIDTLEKYDAIINEYHNAVKDATA